MSSSSEELPLHARLGARAAPRAAAAAPADSDDANSSDSPVPDWISEHQSPYQKGKRRVLEDSSDEDEDYAPDEPPLATQQASTGTAPVKPAAAARKAVAVKKTVTVKKEVKKEVKTEVTVVEAAPDGDDAVTADVKPPKPHAAALSRVAVVMPEKLSRAKALVEVEGADGGRTDLTGDAGAVGRWAATMEDGRPHVQLDLKGVLYGATVVPSATTLMVVNIGQTEAKVEAIFDDYIQLREEDNFGDAEAGLDAYFSDDDENFQINATQDQPQESKQPGKAKPKAKPKAKSAGASKSTKATKPRKPAAKKAKAK